MSQVDDVAKSKWTSLFLFLILDALQILVVSILTLNEATPWMIGFELSQSNAIVSAGLFIGIALFQLIIVYYVSLAMLRNKMMVELYPNFVRKEGFRCKFSREDLVNWSMEVAKNSGVRLDKIYVMQSPLPNAFTFSLPLVGSVLTIHSNLLDLLNPGEVRSIIAHEIGHIKNNDSFVSIFTRMPAFFVDAIYLYIYVRIGLGIATALLVQFDLAWAGIRLIVLFGFFIISRLVIILAHLLIQKASREAELLADYHAAITEGTASTLNALLRLGQRVEAVTSLIEEIRWLESLNPERAGSVGQAELMRMISAYPLDAIDEQNAKTMAPWVFLYTKLRHLREVYGVNLNDEQIISVIEPATMKLLDQRKESQEIKAPQKAPPKPGIVDWREVDYDGDSRLSMDELNDLVSMLRKNPNKYMFDSETGTNLLMIDHPDFRRRVLFLADNCKL
ncbi:MAG: M48 family metallopeptidase [Candidatus Thorarchaeota archaeon]